MSGFSRTRDSETENWTLKHAEFAEPNQLCEFCGLCDLRVARHGRGRAVVPLTRTDEPMYQYACHEGAARSVEDMLRGARVQDTNPR